MFVIRLNSTKPLGSVIILNITKCHIFNIFISVVNNKYSFIKASTYIQYIGKNNFLLIAVK